MTVGIPSIRILGPRRVRWTPHSLASSIQDMRMDHGGPDILVSEKLLHGTDVVTVLQQVSGKDAKPVTSSVFGDPVCTRMQLSKPGMVRCATALLMA
jgi:hypothetical protein